MSRGGGEIQTEIHRSRQTYYLDGRGILSMLSFTLRCVAFGRCFVFLGGSVAGKGKTGYQTEEGFLR